MESTPPRLTLQSHGTDATSNTTWRSTTKQSKFSSTDLSRPETASPPINVLSIAGDSVDVWPNARFISVNDRLPSSIITFSFKRDPNWQSGDAYAWRAKFFNVDEKLEWLIGVEYDNGKVEWINETPDGDGWKELALQTDSLHNPTRLFGYLSAPNKPGTELRIDSVALIRKRLNANNYNRPYTLSIENFNPPVEINDSIANDTVR